MKIYLSDVPRHSLQTIHILTLISTLYRVNYLADASTVWARTDTFEPQLWALTDKSSLVHYHASVKAGCVRLTNNRVRWAPTVDGSQSDPVLDIDLNKFREETSTHFTLIIEHCEEDDANAGVTVIDNSARQEYVNGLYVSDSGVRVIDVARYTPLSIGRRDPDTGEEINFHSEKGITFHKSLTKYHDAHAYVTGNKYIATGKSKAAATKLINNIDKYCIDLQSDQIRSLNEPAARLHNYSKEIADFVAGNLDTLA